MFDSVAVHEDEIEALPTIGQVLASNNVSHIQAAVMRDGVRCFWGVQYHPEFDLEAVSAFISTETDHKLRDGLAQTPEPLGEIISNLRTLSRSPTRDDLSCRYDLSANILDAELRTLEFRNWLQSLVLPRESRRA